MRRARVWHAVVLGLMVCPYPVLSQSDLADRAASAETAGDYNRAIDLLGQAIRLAPRDASLHIAQGAALFHESYFADAIHEFQTALNLRPGDLDALSNLASAWMQIDDLQDAISALELAVAKQPGEQQLLQTLGLCYLQTGQWQQAAEQYRLLLRSDVENPVLLYDLAMAQKHLDDSVAQPLLRKALAVQPDFPAAQFELGEALWQEGSLAEAEASLRNLVKAHPDFLPAYFPLAEVLRQMDRTDEALAATRTILRADLNNASAYQELAILEKGLGHLDAAALAFHEAEERRNRTKLWQAAHTAIESGIRLLRQDNQKAIQKFRFAIQVDPGNAEAHYWLALAIEKNEPAQAAAEFQKAYESDPRLKPPFDSELKRRQP